MTAFLLTRPLRDVTTPRAIPADSRDISTHTPLAGRDTILDRTENGFQISTHTPLAGRDQVITDFAADLIISTHTPLAGRDTCRMDG